MSNGVDLLQATPGTAVPSGSLITPGGQQGPNGQPAYTVNSASFTIPAAGSTVVVNVNNASWAAQGEWVYVAGADGAGGAAVLQITNISGNQLTLLNPGPGTTSPPLASVSGAGLLTQVSGNATDYVGGDNLCHPLSMVSGFVAKSAAYSLLASDSGKYFLCTGNGWTLTLPPAAGGLYYYVRNDQGFVAAGTITIAAQAGKTIDGSASITLLPGQECTIITDSTNWRTFGKQREVVIGTQAITTPVANNIVLLPTGYRYFELRFDRLVSSITGSTQTDLRGKFSFDGGTTWIATNYYSSYVYAASTAPNSATTNNGVEAYLGWPISPADWGSYCHSRIYLYVGETGTERATWTFQSAGWVPQNSYQGTMTGGGFMDQLNKVNGLQYYFGGGNIKEAYLIVKGMV